MKKSVLAFAALLLFAAVAQADLTFYGIADETAFNAATTISILETFDSVTPKDKALASFTSQGVTYAPAVAGGNVWVTSYPYGNFGVAIPDKTVLTATGDEDFTLAMAFATPVTAVGFDTYLNRFGPVTIQVHNGDGWTSTVFSHDYTIVGFFGVTSPSPIDMIRWTAVGGAVQNTGIDNVQIGVVPVPAAVLLGMLGLGTAGLRLRRSV